ncbi:MAG: hypothetical protein R2732_08455 [Microbacteriaceae bacterium]|jgi:hypothetical protein|nr:hypothetical protein [Microbacteriaceae bacterium]HPZ35216.1 hypothetical protein [Microbacteriaceae bacterium]HQC92671.1 hypothetical protein [Microbacteriaceae bacterium]
MRRQLTALFIAGTLALGLAACSSPGATGGAGFGGGQRQSVAEACTAFGQAIAGSQDLVGGALRDAQTDPTKTVEAFGTLETTLGDAFSAVSNAEVSALGDSLLDSLGVLADAAEAVIVDGDTARAAELTEAGRDFALRMQELQALCG